MIKRKICTSFLVYVGRRVQPSMESKPGGGGGGGRLPWYINQEANNASFLYNVGVRGQSYDDRKTCRVTAFSRDTVARNAKLLLRYRGRNKQ